MQFNVERQPAPEAARITPDELLSLMSAGVPLQILDVRTGIAYQSSGLKIPGAIRLDPNDITPALGLYHDVPTVTYCT